MLLVHGFATSCDRTWRETGLIDLLEDAGRRVIGVDLLGHGAAPKPHDPAAYDHLENAIADALPPDGVVDAVGYSLGARLVLGLASRQPARFGRLVVAGAGANLFRTDDRGALAKVLETGAAEDDVVAAHFVQLANTAGNDVEALVACLRRREEPITAETLAPITGPVLVVLGDQDFAGPADPLLEALADARLVTLPGVDHFATPKSFGFIDAMLEFLDAQPT